MPMCRGLYGSIISITALSINAIIPYLQCISTEILRDVAQPGLVYKAAVIVSKELYFVFCIKVVHNFHEWQQA